MERSFLFVFIVFLFLLPSLACSEPEQPWGWYIRFDTGFSNADATQIEIPETSKFTYLSDSLVISGGLGYAFFPGLRMDATITHRSQADGD